ncbi:7913_t:CDS:2, partial [Funneliformis geosporum]
MSTKLPQSKRYAAIGRPFHWRSLLKVYPLQAVNIFCFFEGDLESAVKLEGTKCWNKGKNDQMSKRRRNYLRYQRKQ